MLLSHDTTPLQKLKFRIIQMASQRDESHQHDQKRHLDCCSAGAAEFRVAALIAEEEQAGLEHSGAGPLKAH